MVTLLPEDDAATVNWGDGWCTPTKDQLNELENNTKQKWSTLNDVEGMFYIGNNGKSLFIPEGCYWANILRDTTEYACADDIWVHEKRFLRKRYNTPGCPSRYEGEQIRPVCSSRQK